MGWSGFAVVAGAGGLAGFLALDLASGLVGALPVLGGVEATAGEWRLEVLTGLAWLVLDIAWSSVSV